MQKNGAMLVFSVTFKRIFLHEHELIFETNQSFGKKFENHLYASMIRTLYSTVCLTQRDCSLGDYENL